MNSHLRRLAPAVVSLALSCGTACAGVIFSDSFDASPDWRSGQTVSKGAGGEDRGWPATFTKACSKSCPPRGWTAYRASASRFSDTPGADTYVLSSEGARGGKGKGITLNVESTTGYGDWSGGSLDLHLGGGEHRELYVRFWLRYDREWLWTDPSRSQHGQQKLIRISRFNGDINAAASNPQMYFRPTQNGPSWIPEWYYNKSFPPASFFSAEFFNPQPNGSIGYGPTRSYPSLRWPSDGKWHSYEFRVKMNSAPGVADGEWEIWIDGEAASDKHAVKKNVLWVDASGSVAKGWNYLMFLDNITVAPAPLSARKEMKIFMDDVVVATEYSGPPPVPEKLSAAGSSDTSVRLRWSPGENGASYPLDGYHIYYGKESGRLTSRVDVGKVTEYEVAGLEPSTRYYFALTGSSKGGFEANGNEGGRATADAVSVDTLPPQLSILPKAATATPAGRWISGTVSDPGGIAAVTVRAGAAEPVPAILAGNSWSCAIPEAPEGMSILVTAKDLAGNESRLALPMAPEPAQEVSLIASDTGH